MLKLKKHFSLPLRDSERQAILVLLDIIAVNIALFLSLGIRPEYELNLSLLAKGPHWFLIFSLIWLLMAHVFDLYDLSVASTLQNSSLKIAQAGLISCGLFFLIPYLTPILPPGRRYVLPFFIFVISFVFFLRLGYNRLISEPFMKRRALIIGTGWEASSIAQVINEYGRNAYEIVGAVRIKGKISDLDDGLKNRSEKNLSQSIINELHGPNNCEILTREIPLPPESLNQLEKMNDDISLKQKEAFLPLLGDIADVKKLIKEYDIKTLILAYPTEMDGLILEMITESLELGVEIVPMVTLYERFTGRVPVEHIGDQWYVAMPINHPGTGTLWPLVKRMVDLVLASMGMIFLAIVTPFIALAIYIDSPGPIFYKQKRVGKGGKEFTAIKFRSMIPNAENDRPVWAKKGDPRVTRVGKILRKTHIDEFPQFINILKGEMSVVGPRAERPEFVEELKKEIPFYCVRHAVRPGMAGWGLVKQGYGASKEDALVKLQYDLYYIKHQGPWLDTIIFLKTVWDTITFRGRA